MTNAIPLIFTTVHKINARLSSEASESSILVDKIEATLNDKQLNYKPRKHDFHVLNKFCKRLSVTVKGKRE